MNVELLQYPEHPERAVATAARLCYAPVGATELMETMPPERVQSVLSTIMKSGHFSTLEHVSYTFAVDGVSRALTHQLVRHRLASFNQQSQRYVKFAGDVEVVKPPTVAAQKDTSRVFDEATMLLWMRTISFLMPVFPPKMLVIFCPMLQKQRSSLP